MSDIEQYIYDIREAENVEEAFATLQKYLSQLGLDRVVYSLMTDFRSIGLPAGHAILGNYPDDWMEYYRQQGYEDIDPVRKILMLTNEPFRWTELQRYKEIEKIEKSLMGEAQDAKLLDGFGLGIHCPFGEVIGMGFASSSGGVGEDEFTRSQVRIAAQEFHSVFMGLHAHRQRRLSSVLSRREIEVLKWLARGKSVPETTAILSVDGSISEATVRFHVKNIYAKLEVSSVPQAVAKSLSNGILTFADLNNYI